ncbi:pol-like protein [Lasius niger]|uniref:Pol-like protein n=1 Tax=Lasius niger TaxID=67767 RepID=A0A0J7KJJ8_LASNI|nr:pol-like protein [Lasius niger]
MGDFNAHNTTWNCVQTDTNGDRLWEVTYNKDLICLNEDTMSRLGENYHQKTKWKEYQNAVGHWMKEKRGVDNCRREAGTEQIRGIH